MEIEIDKPKKNILWYLNDIKDFLEVWGKAVLMGFRIILVSLIEFIKNIANPIYFSIVLMILGLFDLVFFEGYFFAVIFFIVSFIIGLRLWSSGFHREVKRKERIEKLLKMANKEEVKDGTLENKTKDSKLSKQT